MSAIESKLKFIDNPVIASRQTNYTTITIDVVAVLESWRISLFSYEWLYPDGRIKPIEDLPTQDQPRRQDIESRLSSGDLLEKPVLGIGLMDNVEIGAGRATFLTLAAHGCKTIPVHIPISNTKEFSPFCV